MIELFIFILVIFLYVHIVVQYKSSEELDIYEIDYHDNPNLQKICDGLQPFIFEDPAVTTTRFEDPDAWILYEPFAPEQPMELPKSQAEMALSQTQKEYYSESPIDDIDGIDSYLKPPFTVYREAMLLGGTCDTVTPFVYHTNSRRFLVVMAGQISLKLAPWKKNCKNLYEIQTAGNGGRSPVNVWTPEPRHRRSWEKVEFVDIMAKQGQVIYIPPFWGYSLKYQEPKTRVLQWSCCTIFNRIAFIGDMMRFSTSTKMEIPKEDAPPPKAANNITQID